MSVVLSNIEWIIPVLAACANIAYGVVLYMCGPTSYSRARGIEHVKDTLFAIITFSVMYLIYRNLPYLLYVIFSSLGILHECNTNIPIMLTLQNSENYFLSMFNSIKTLLLTIFTACTVLNTIPYTSPVAVYFSQATQYLQWMSHWALINSYMLYILAIVSTHALSIAGLGLALSVPQQTRSIGSILTAISIAFPSYVLGMYFLTKSLNIYILSEKVTYTNVLNVVKDIALGGFDLAEKLQTFNIMCDLGLAITGAATYTISKLIDNIGHYIKL